LPLSEYRLNAQLKLGVIVRVLYEQPGPMSATFAHLGNGRDAVVLHKVLEPHQILHIHALHSVRNVTIPKIGHELLTFSLVRLESPFQFSPQFRCAEGARLVALRECSR
jgi:hypothetical protein